jgi:hypothetical protein
VVIQNPGEDDDLAHYITGMFSDPKAAEHAFERMIEGANFDPSEVSIVQVRNGKTEDVPVHHETGVPTGIKAGAAIGAGLGAAGMLAVAAPGVLVAGPIAIALQSALSGAVGGTALGTLFGALGGLAFWWDEPDFGKEHGRSGILVGVQAEGTRADDARAELEKAGALRIFG